MKENEKYWLNLYNEGLIEIDFETGNVYSYLSGKRKEIGTGRNQTTYGNSSAGPSRQERYHMLMHRLIWICANGDIPPLIEINHKNGNKGDNRLINLELVDKSGNALHSRRILKNKGGVARGEKAGNAKLTWEKVDKIREMRKTGLTLKELAKIFEITLHILAQL